MILSGGANPPPLPPPPFVRWVSPGLRCGFVTAPRPLIVKLAQGAGPSLGVSSPVQVFLVEMLRRWGPVGLNRHVQRVQAGLAEMWPRVGA